MISVGGGAVFGVMSVSVTSSSAHTLMRHTDPLPRFITLMIVLRIYVSSAGTQNSRGHVHLTTCMTHSI